MHLAAFWTLAGAFHGSWMYSVGKFFEKNIIQFTNCTTSLFRWIPLKLVNIVECSRHSDRPYVQSAPDNSNVEIVGKTMTTTTTSTYPHLSTNQHPSKVLQTLSCLPPTISTDHHVLESMRLHAVPNGESNLPLAIASWLRQSKENRSAPIYGNVGRMRRIINGNSW